MTDVTPPDWHAWTRDRFQSWLRKTGGPVHVEPPYELAPCRCGDVNCHGWRLVAAAKGEPDAPH
jgi:hypothetical protein